MLDWLIVLIIIVAIILTIRWPRKGYGTPPEVIEYTLRCAQENAAREVERMKAEKQEA